MHLLEITFTYLCILPLAASVQDESDCDEQCLAGSASFTANKKCNVGYYVTTDGYCAKCNPPCFRCHNSTSCIDCPRGYGLASDNRCEACHSACATCANSTVCITCNEYSYLTHDGKCEDCSLHCLSCSNTTYCNECSNGSYMTSFGLCEPCPMECMRCSNSSVCIECRPYNYLNSDGICEACPEGCLNCSNSSVCIECQAFNYLSPDGSCKGCKDPDCQTCDATTCFECLPFTSLSPVGTCEYKLCSEEDWNYINDRFKSRYSRFVPPIDYPGLIYISLNMSLIDLLDLDEQMERLTTSWNVLIGWSDININWNPSEYGNCAQVLIPGKKIWTPRLAIVNTYDSSINSRFFDESSAVITVDFNGYTKWVFIGVLSTTCSLDMKYYPYDIQTCQIVIESVTLRTSQMVLIPAVGSTIPIEFDNNNQWTILHTAVEIGKKNSTSQLIFSIKMVRKPLHVFVNVAIPIILLNVLTLAGFFIPYEERLSFNITIFLTFMVLTMVIAEKLPESSDTIPLLGIYAMLSMVCSVIVLFAMAFINNKRQISDDAEPRGYLVSLLTRIHRLFTKDLMRINQRHYGKRSKDEQKEQPKECEMALSDEKSNIQSRSTDNDDSEGYKTGYIEENSSAAVGKKKVTWNRLIIVLDRLSFCVFLLMHLILFIHTFVVVPLMQGYKLPEYRYYG